jgi:hypothetical protein
MADLKALSKGASCLPSQAIEGRRKLEGGMALGYSRRAWPQRCRQTPNSEGRQRRWRKSSDWREESGRNSVSDEDLSMLAVASAASEAKRIADGMKAAPPMATSASIWRNTTGDWRAMQKRAAAGGKTGGGGSGGMAAAASANVSMRKHQYQWANRRWAKA